MSLPSDLMFPMPDDIEALTEAERSRRARLTEHFAMLDARCFIRGSLPLRFRQADQEFSYSTWIEVSRADFDVARKLWPDPGARSTLRCSGRLANVLPPFEEDRDVRLEGRVLPGRDQPTFQAMEGSLAEAQLDPGMSPDDHSAIVGEALSEMFARHAEVILGERWSPLKAAEEFRGRDWRRGPRLVTIGEFEPDEYWPWRYATLGLCARAMPGTQERIELIWEFQRRVDHPSLFESMARIAALPWHLRTTFRDGAVQPFPAGFPPESQFRSLLFYDATRWDGRLAQASILEQPITYLCVVPLLEKERASINAENVEAFIRNLADHHRA